MNRVSISLNTFVDLVGTTGVSMFRRYANGSSWMLPDGRIAAEMWNGSEWSWYLTEVL